MSRFNIYQIDYHDPIKIGRKRRIMFTLCSSLVFVIWAIINIANATHNKMTLLFVLLFSVAIFIFVLYFLKLKRETKKIKVIGEIEFTTSLLRKRIGDSLTEYNYQTIKEIEIQKHIPATSAIDLQNGYFSYILKIIFTDLHSESIVISNKSINRRKKLTIIEKNWRKRPKETSK